MFNFKNDYAEGCHPRILEALTRTNLEQTVGYGLDEHCAQAAALIKQAIGCETADVHFLVGGTQTNLTAIAAFLRPHQCVLAAASGHINVHEAGAIEATGHKIISRATPDGKLTAALVQEMVDEHTDEHMVRPGMVYLSQSTELGSVYTKAELEALYACCRKNGLYLYIDGARLACALASDCCDLSLSDLPGLCDAFYIGGTKNGMLFGEALVIVHDALKADFRFLLKQRGGMLAKGRLLGIQFAELFRDGLYLELGRHANALTQRLQAGLEAKGYPLLQHSHTNQVFFTLTPEQYARFSQLVLFETWATLPDGRVTIRLVTSWATTPEAVDAFLAEI